MTTGGDISKISSMSGAACWNARTAEEVLWGLQEDNGTAFLLTSAQAQSGDVRSMVLHQLSGDFQRPEPNPINVLPGLDRESPVLFKHADHYFLITSGEGRRE